MDTKETILVVDDTRDNLRVLDAILTNAGYEVCLFRSARMALHSLELNKPDLILLDICMPEMDGFTLCENMKSMPDCSSIPVLFISALNDVKDKVKAFSAGGVDYITKPFQAEEVLARVKTHVSIFQLEQKLLAKNRDLEEALERINTLRGLIPICSNCKKVRDDSGYWEQIESYISVHSDAEFSHSICPACVHELYPDMEEELLSEVTKQ